MKNSFLSIVLLLFFANTLSAQHLTISSTGQTGSIGTNWSILNNVLYIGNSGSASINTSVITNHLATTGDLTITLPGEPNVARNIYINNTIAYLGSNARTLTFQSGNDIVFANAVGITSATANLNIVLRAATTTGSPDNGSVTMNGINLDTKGGHIWVGGGATTTTWNGLNVGNSSARTYSDNLSGISLVGSSITSSGGKINMNALSWDSFDDDGVNYGMNIENSNISSGAGDIYINADIYGRYTNGIGLRVTGNTTITSTSGPIYVRGYGLDATTNGNSWRQAASIQGSAQIKSVSGSITVVGDAAFTATANDKEGLIVSDGASICSQTGNITLRGTNTLESSGQFCNSIRFAAADLPNSIRIGFDGTNAYSGNITIEGNSIYQRFTHLGTGSIAVRTSGTLTIQPTGNSFTYMRAANWDPLTYDDDWNFGTTLSGFTLGKSTNTTNLTFANVLSTAGPITMYGGLITLNSNLTTTTSGGAILVKASDQINTADSRTFNTNNGDFILWCDSDNSSGGRVWLGNNNVINTANGSTSSGLSGGGKIVLAGGLDNGANGGTAFDGIPDGFASNANSIGVYLGNTASNYTQMYSGGGDILVRGSSTLVSSSVQGLGVYSDGRWLANSGKGSINIHGTSAWYYGINFSSPVTNTTSGNKHLQLISDKVSGTAISITGTGSNHEGVVFNYLNPKEILATGGGAIVINGTAGTYGPGVFLQNTDILATSGDITVNGSGSGTAGIRVTSYGARFGSRAGSDITSSTSNIRWSVNSMTLDGLTSGFTNSFNTTGTATVEPLGTSFASAFTFPISNLTIASTVSGLIIGRTTNTANITLGSAVTAAGPITIYGGLITLNSNLTTTTNTGHISLLAKTHITNSSATTITTQGGNVLFASNVDDGIDGESTTNGYIQLRAGITVNSNGGNITFGGGNTSGSDYALGSSDIAYTEGIRFDVVIALNSGGGNISLRGKSYAMGVHELWGASGVGFYFFSGATGTINSGTGTITIDGYSQTHTSTYAAGFYCMHNLTISSANTTANAISITGKATGASGEAWGIESESTLSVLATGTGGGITISTSTQLVNNFDAVFRGETNILALSGPINFKTGQLSGVANSYLYLNGHMYLGSKAGSTVTSSSSNINMQVDRYWYASGALPQLATSGSLTIQPNATSFGMDIYTSYFNLNQNSQTMYGFTFGKSGNIGNLYPNTAVTSTGPVNIYGATIGITGALTASGSDVSLYASTAVTQSQPIVSSGLSLNGTGTFNLTNTSNSFSTLAGGAVGSLLGATQVTDISGGLTIGTVGSNSGLLGSSTFRVETLAGNLTLAGNISTSNATTDAVILTAAKNTVIGVGTGGDIIVSGTPTITMGSGGIAKLFSGLESTSTGLTALAGGSSNVRNNYDETTSTFSPVLSANNKYAIYRTSAGVGALTIVSSSGDAINTTWTYDNGVINTISGTVNILSSVIENYLAIGPLTINAGNTTISAAISSTSLNALVLNANSTLSNTTPTTNVNAAITNGGSITFNTGTFNVAQNITTTSTAAITISATNQISTSTATRRTISTQGGNITLNADNDANGSGWLDIDDLTLNPGTGNLIVRGETFNINGTESRKPYINGTGSFTFESNDASFGQDIGSNWFVIDQDANGISGLTIGKSESTTNTYLNSAFTVAGPINVYGGYVEVSSTITSSATGDIFLKGIANSGSSVNIYGGITKTSGTGTLTMQAHGRAINSGTISATGTGILNVVMWSDYDGDNVGGGSTLNGGSVSTNRGHVWMGGSNSNGGTYTWNGLTVGDGPSIGTGISNCHAIDLFAPITTSGGDILLWAGNGGCGTSGIVTDVNRHINAGSGDITLIAYQTAGAIELTSTGVISLLPHAGSYATALTFGGTETSGNFSFNTSHYNGMKINSIANVGGLTIGKYDGMLSSGTPVVLGNTSNVSLSTNTNIGGPITVYGGTIALEANLTTTNNGDISLYTDNALGGLTTTARTITAAGSFNYIPRSDFFSVPVTYPITNLNLVSKGLLIGKPTNTANIIFANATTVAGPITAYGGTITLNANLTTTNSSNFGTISLYTDNPLGGLTIARTLNAAGSFKYIPRTTAFTADVTYPIANLTATSAGLTIGKTTNDKNITINQDVTGPFGIELYGANVNINSNLTTTGITAIMYLKGNTTIAAGKFITSGGNFTHDGNMTFKSAATGTAAFGTLGGTFTTVSGNTTVERYIPARRAFRFLTSAVTTTSNIRTNWQENGGTAAGLGTHITGTNGAANGFDPTGTNTTSIFTFNNTTAAWVPVGSSTSNTLTAGTPYRINIRGDRTIDLSTNTPTPTNTTLRATGALATGSINAGVLSSTANAYNFIGNPYQAPVNMKTALDAATNLNNLFYYVWDPRINTRGAYISVDLTSTNGTPNNLSSAANKFLQPGQACFVRTGATPGSASLTFQESYKVVSSPNTNVFRTDTQNTTALSTIKLRLFDSNSLALNLNALDGLVVFFDDAFSSSVDQNDAGKFTNPDEMLSTFNNGDLISIEKRQHPTSADIIPLRTSQYRVTDYTLVAEGTNLNGVPAYLHDQFLQTYTEIPQSGVVNYPFNVVTTNAQTTASDRFRIVFSNPLLNTANNEWKNFTLYPNPSKQGNFNIILGQPLENGKVTIYNTLGVKVYNQDLENTIENSITPNQSMPTGVYYVEIQNGSERSIKKLIIE